MQRLALFTTIALTACAGSDGTTHHINEAQGFCLTTPESFEEIRITLDEGTGLTPRQGSDRYALADISGASHHTLEIGVNDYDDMPEKQITVEYVFEVQEDGSVTQTDRKLHVPQFYSYPHVAMSLFYGPDKKDVFFFRMDLMSDDSEDLYVDIVSSFLLID